MKTYTIIVLHFIFYILGCQNITGVDVKKECGILNTQSCIINENIIQDCQEGVYDFDGYDIVLIIGQSNTHNGLGIDSILDMSWPKIKQLGRKGNNNLKIIIAHEPLDHHTKQKNKIGFALTFAKMYACEFLESQRDLLIVPCGFGGSGFINNRWNKGEDLYEDAVNRVNYILEKFPNSYLKAFLWHQGEQDIDNPNYKKNIDTMIHKIRQDINQKDNEKIPFILGGMVPFWVDQSETRLLQECIIKNTPKRIDHTGFVNPREPCTIIKEDNAYNAAHYDSYGQREMGKRYFSEYKKIYSPN